MRKLSHFPQSSDIANFGRVVPRQGDGEAPVVEEPDRRHGAVVEALALARNASGPRVPEAHAAVAVGAGDDGGLHRDVVGRRGAHGRLADGLACDVPAADGAVAAGGVGPLHVHGEVRAVDAVRVRREGALGTQAGRAEGEEAAGVVAEARDDVLAAGVQAHDGAADGLDAVRPAKPARAIVELDVLVVPARKEAVRPFREANRLDVAGVGILQNESRLSWSSRHAAKSNGRSCTCRIIQVSATIGNIVTIISSLVCITI